MDILKEIKMTVINTDVLKKSNRVLVTKINEDGYSKTYEGVVTDISESEIHVEHDDREWTMDLLITVDDIINRVISIDKIV